MIKKVPATRKVERGQSLVELAVSLIVIMLLLVGMVEFGIAFFQFVQLRDAAQEGVLYGVLNPDDDNGIVNRVRASSSAPIDLQNDPNLTITPALIGSACEGNSIQVIITYPHQIIMPLIGPVIGTNTIRLTAISTGTILQPVCP